MKYQELNKDQLLPWNMVSTDQYILRYTDRFYQKKGKLDPSEMFSGGCIFIGHTSGYVSIKHQLAINDTETAREKLTLEREDEIQGVTIKGYHTNDGIFNALEFM